MKGYGVLKLVVVCYLVVIAGLVIGAIAISADKNDIVRFVGASLGAFVSGSVAILVFWFARRSELEERRRKIQSMRQAIWQDIWGTLPCVLEGYDEWNILSKMTEPCESRFWTVEQLKPVVFNAYLSQLYELETHEQHLLQLFHDNLRIASEAILEAGSYDNVNLELAAVIAHTLKVACGDGYRAAAALDPGGPLKSKLMIEIGNTRWRNPGWEDDMVKLLGRQRY